MEVLIGAVLFLSALCFLRGLEERKKENLDL